MDDTRNHSFDPPSPDPPYPHSPHRRFVYRSVEPDARQTHPLRRATDTPRPFQGIAGELCPNPLLLKFRVYLKLN